MRTRMDEARVFNSWRLVSRGGIWAKARGLNCKVFSTGLITKTPSAPDDRTEIAMHVAFNHWSIGCTPARG